MAAVAVGKFDALHLGHRALAQCAAGLGSPVLARLTGMAGVLGWPERAPLVAEADRLRVLDGWSAGLGRRVDEVGLDFVRIRGLAATAFVDLCRSELSAEALVVGRDFRCGRDRSAGTAELAEICSARGIRLAVVDPVLIGAEAASSSRIRAALGSGDVATAEACLGRPHRLVGTVRRGDGRGRQLGFPTINLGPGEGLAPRAGVYAGFAEVGRRRIAAAVNIGVLPTVGSDRPLTIEAHLIGWSGECYGARIGIDLKERIRDEQRFPSLEDLRRRIASDVEASVALLCDG